MRAEAHLKNGDLLQHREIHVQRQLGLELVREQTKGGVDVTPALYPAARPAVVVPPEYPSLHTARHLVVPHVGLGAVQEPLELETVRVPVRDDVADLADDGREYEDANQVADYREDVPANQEGRKRADQSEGDVISVLRLWTSGPRRSLSPDRKSVV